MGSESDCWKEPTEIELQEIRDRRARSDLISKIMSDYMLKGYRMLADNCDVCGNVLLDDKKGRKFCVACEEADKSGSTAVGDIKPQLPSVGSAHFVSGASSNLCSNTLFASSNNSTINKGNSDHNSNDVTQYAFEVVQKKLEEAVSKLASSIDPLESADYAHLIKNCTDAMCSLKKWNKM